MASSDCESLIAEILSPDRFLHQDSSHPLFGVVDTTASGWLCFAWPPTTPAPSFPCSACSVPVQGKPWLGFASIAGPEPMRWASFRMSSDETLRIT